MQVQRRKGGDSLLCVPRAVSAQPGAERSGKRVHPGSGPGPQRLRAPGAPLPRTYSVLAAPAFWGYRRWVTSFGRFFRCPGNCHQGNHLCHPCYVTSSLRCPRGSSESDRGSGGPGDFEVSKLRWYGKETGVTGWKRVSGAWRL